MIEALANDQSSEDRVVAKSRWVRDQLLRSRTVRGGEIFQNLSKRLMVRLVRCLRKAADDRWAGQTHW